MFSGVDYDFGNEEYCFYCSSESPLLKSPNNYNKEKINKTFIKNVNEMSELDCDGRVGFINPSLKNGEIYKVPLRSVSSIDEKGTGKNFFQFQSDVEIIPVEQEKAVGLKKETKSKDKKVSVEPEQNTTLITTLKSELGEAGYRVLTKKLLKGTKAAILKTLESKKESNEKVKMVSEFLDSDIGEFVLAELLGVIIPNIPKISNDPRAQKIAEELRISAMADAGNLIADSALGTIVPMITSAIESLPKSSEMLRIATGGMFNDEETQALEQEEEPEETVKPKAKRV